MSEFKVGDKVRVKEGTDWGRIEGLTGVISLIDESSHYLNVTLDELPQSVIDDGAGRENWFVLAEEIELLEA